MTRKKKILIILHLCFAFAYLSWLLLKPYVREVVSQKSQIALYEMVLGREALFQQLAPDEQTKIIEGHSAVHHQQGQGMLRKLREVFFVETPPFALAWLFFSLTIGIFLLLRIEGAMSVAWLLPLIVLGYAYFLKESPQEENSLFPSEEYVLTNYVAVAEKQGRKLRDTLLLGWHRYLICEWAGEIPSSDQASCNEQLEKGLFSFNVARLKWILDGKGDEIILTGFTAPPSLLRIACYFIWNLLFAWFINRKEREESGAAVSKASC